MNNISQELKKALEFVTLLDRFRQVRRGLLVTGEDRWENDSEHSYHLAMLAWYIIDSQKLDLDLSKVLRYALAHDVVEAYAGDTFAYTKDQSHRDSKEEREAQAADRIAKEFPEFEDIMPYINGYKDKVDAEARFVYALDKLEPDLHIYLDNGKSWQKQGLSREDGWNYKKDKFGLSPEIEKLCVEFYDMLKDKEHLFTSKVDT